VYVCVCVGVCVFCACFVCVLCGWECGCVCVFCLRVCILCLCVCVCLCACVCVCVYVCVCVCVFLGFLGVGWRSLKTRGFQVGESTVEFTQERETGDPCFGKTRGSLSACKFWLSLIPLHLCFSFFVSCLHPECFCREQSAIAQKKFRRFHMFPCVTSHWHTCLCDMAHL